MEIAVHPNGVDSVQENENHKCKGELV